MDLENQRAIKSLVDEHGAQSLVVVLGGADPEGLMITAETVMKGDPSYAGPLAGVSLGLPVYHILEGAVKTMIPPQVYEEKVGLMEMVVDVEAISRVFKAIRGE